MQGGAFGTCICPSNPSDKPSKDRLILFNIAVTYCMCTVHLMATKLNRNEYSPLYAINSVSRGYVCPSCTTCIYYPVSVCPLVPPNTSFWIHLMVRDHATYYAFTFTHYAILQCRLLKFTYYAQEQEYYYYC